MMKILRNIALLVAIVPVWATAEQFTPVVLQSMNRLGSVQVSPDGKQILYSVTKPSVKDNNTNTDLWVMDIDGSNAHQITYTPRSEGEAVWLGNKIAFTYRDGDNGTQMWVMNADGSGRTCVSHVKGGIEGFKVSPDGKHVVVISTVKAGKDIHDLNPDLDKANAHEADDIMYRHWDEWLSEVPHPFVGDFDGTTVTNLKDVLEGTEYESPMRPNGGTEEFAWTADSKGIIYVCRKKTGKDYALSTNSDLYLYNLETGTTQNLTEGMMGYDDSPIVSPSGKLAWLSMEHDGYESDKFRIFMMDHVGGEKVDLTANWDYTADEIAWSADEKYIYFISAFEGTKPIFRIDVKTKKVETLTKGDFDYSTLIPVGKDRMIACRRSFTQPTEIYSLQWGKEPVKISSVDDEMMAKTDMATCRREIVTTTDGKPMVVWVLLPPNFDETKKYPSIVYCEGGPQFPVTQFWSYRWNLALMACQGYVVIAPNRRGMPGFGTEWNAEISGDFGGQCMKDFFSAADYMKTKPYIDGSKMGAVGASFGGYTVYWLAGHHNKRFSCFIAHAGMFDMASQYRETEEMWWANWDYAGAPWDKANARAQKTYGEFNPCNEVDKWDTPIMCIGGEKDFRISYTQQLQAFNSARLRGIPARLLIFPEENHRVSGIQDAVLWYREFFRWLDKWLK